MALKTTGTISPWIIVHDLFLMHKTLLLWTLCVCVCVCSLINLRTRWTWYWFLEYPKETRFACRQGPYEDQSSDEGLRSQGKQSQTSSGILSRHGATPRRSSKRRRQTANGKLSNRNRGMRTVKKACDRSPGRPDNEVDKLLHPIQPNAAADPCSPPRRRAGSFSCLSLAPLSSNEWSNREESSATVLDF